MPHGQPLQRHADAAHATGCAQAIADAEVGDEQRKEDPTVNRLQERVAELLGHEAGLFLPSGTMCNGIGFRLHIRAGGDEVLLHRWSHPIVAEAGGPAELAGAMVNRLDGDGGMFTAEQVEEALWPDDRYMPRSRLVSVEQTTNMGGGRVWPLEQMQEVLDVAREPRHARPPRRRPAPERRRWPPACRRPTTRPASTPPGSTSRRGSGRRWAPCSAARAS